MSPGTNSSDGMDICDPSRRTIASGGMICAKALARLLMSARLRFKSLFGPHVFCFRFTIADERPFPSDTQPNAESSSLFGVDAS
eukprot:CAMPEP_0184489244 /NCGR_PEP_ID=MMETSP0113_2-20130426/14926_1 /TAXON_ID=91329 /ORGANISM="Norrisiella sphaerica, Strain BC52" /LENGTH=83 /DNA_ID=CAMNT_0026872565 /DNA_START=355 /DNA_END=606 /DNA_ORIENTATION=-